MVEKKNKFYYYTRNRLQILNLQPEEQAERMAIMSLKKLSRFTYFDIEEFLEKKKLLSVGITEWKDFDTQNVMGTKVEVVIAVDKTDYGNAEGEIVSNLYEKLTVKVPAKIDVPMNVEVRLVNPEAVVYGEYRNSLSITADSIEVVGK